MAAVDQASDSVTVVARPRRVGVVSINPKVADPQARTFEHLLAGVGQNTGNLMFTEAMFRLIDGEVEKIGFAFDPVAVSSRFDVVVVPAANWLNRTADWSWFLPLLERLTIPVVVIGIGLQAPEQDLSAVEVSPSARSLAEFFAGSAAAVSVRGAFTQRWLETIGIGNAVVTGCPSLYMNIFSGDAAPDTGTPVLQATRYNIEAAFARSASVDAALFRASAALGLPMIFQSEREEMEMLVYGRDPGTLDAGPRDALLALYRLPTADALRGYLDAHGHVFFDVRRWSSFVRRHAGVVGTRLHGAIVALNSGRPAVLVPHDSRTAEVAEFAAIPTADPALVLAAQSADDYRALLAAADTEAYRERRRANQETFVTFLRDVGLRPRPEHLF